MTAQLRLSSVWLGGLALVLVGFLGILGFGQDVRAAGNYNVSLQAPDLVRQFENVELFVVVKDSQGQPANGLPVTFQVAPDWRRVAKLSPDQVLTHDGTARATFEAAMPGVVTVTAQIDDTTSTTHITVTTHGSRVYDKQP